MHRHSLPELAADRRNSAPSTSLGADVELPAAKVVERFYEKRAFCLDDADIAAVTGLYRGPSDGRLEVICGHACHGRSRVPPVSHRRHRNREAGDHPSDGRPHAAPVWFDLDDDGTVVLTTGADSVKGKTFRRDSRVCLCVDDETPPYSFVVIDRIAGRYMGVERAEQYGRRNATPGEPLVRITPNHIVARADLAN
jgi:Pyridoxamine 5'-phosphate oxidase